MPTNVTEPFGGGQGTQGISLVAFVTALVGGLSIFGVQMLAFILFKEKLARILYVDFPSILDLLLMMLVNPRLTWSPHENEQNLHRELPGAGLLPFSNSEIERLSRNAVSTLTSSYDTYKPSSLFSYPWP